MFCVHTNPDLHNAFWEGFTQAHEVTNLFVWNFMGETEYSTVNFPGIWNDYMLEAASCLYSHRMMRDTPDGFALIADRAFPHTVPRLQGNVVRERKANELKEPNCVPKSAWLAAVHVIVSCSIPSER